MFLAHFVLRYGNAKIKVEVGGVGGGPRELPFHALFEGVDLVEWRSRSDQEPHVPLRQMGSQVVEMICQQRTTRAALLPVRPEHEVINHQLALRAEQLWQRFLPRTRVK